MNKTEERSKAVDDFLEKQFKGEAVSPPTNSILLNSYLSFAGKQVESFTSKRPKGCELVLIGIDHDIAPHDREHVLPFEVGGISQSQSSSVIWSPRVRTVAIYPRSPSKSPSGFIAASPESARWLKETIRLIKTDWGYGVESELGGSIKVYSKNLTSLPQNWVLNLTKLLSESSTKENTLQFIEIQPQQVIVFAGSPNLKLLSFLDQLSFD